ncbi:MAG: response regulator transcription factor [Afipia sp.]|jgi:FixJ family two-component response regulator|nr:response regulator transcription factor [Afipia sp.]
MQSFAAPDNPVVIVDDDISVRDALSLLFRVDGFPTETFSNGEAFLDALPDIRPECVILDLELPGSSGLAVLRQLSERRFAAPVFVISGRCDVPTAVEVMKLGARDFLEKPFSASAMIDRVRDAAAAHKRASAGHIDGLADFPGRDLLTCRERDVLLQVAHGASNKEAGRRLGISPRTVEVHRASIMDKLGARNAADLIRIVLSEGLPRQTGRAG